VVQLVPSMRDGDGRALHPGAVGGLVSGMAVLYLTGLLVSV
jgi:zinc transporter, ZIP family